MKKTARFLTAVMMIVVLITMSISAYALTIRPQLSFDGTIATCAVTVVGGNTSEHIEVEMKLMHGSTCIDSWYSDGYGYVVMKEYADATRGLSYDLYVTVTVNGVSHTPVYVSNTC